ncbi:hypothetical protein BJ973_002281 [Actinoplanes tereljensis]|uniref:ABC-type transport system involved in multi-copper enzyme maturation permease subunit n=1 Tax=Paractinoplanes tereljensis TaxID=571912 RepID=A0A919NQ03_9ACTN|nr:ABC transporter permease subunit [Actinoplanes tereljensis]GIF21956.1 hypothetical protein Ate02nite_46860 [Actinoplanes tereljensis]
MTMLRAEWTKLRSATGWLAGLIGAAAVILGLGVLAAFGVTTSCGEQEGADCPHPPTGPSGQAVNDHFSFVHQPLTGDGTITAHVADFTGIITYPPPDHDQIVEGLVPWAKAGLIVKDGTKPGSAYASVLVTGAHGTRMQHNFTEDHSGPAAARWLRLSRSGETIRGYASADAVDWTEIQSVRLPGLPQTVQIGLFVASPSNVTAKAGAHGGSIVQARFTQATAVFDQVSATGSWTYDNVGDEPAMQTDWEQFHQAEGFTTADGRLTVTGTGDIAPAGQEGGPTITFTLAGLIAALLIVIVVAVLFITAEYRRGLIRTTLAAMPHRGRVLTAKAAVIGAAVFVAGLVATAVTLPLAGHVLRARGNFLLPVPTGTLLRIIVGSAVLLALTAVLAYAIGAVLRRGVPAVALAILAVIVPYLLATTSVLPTTAAQWLMRVTPAAAFAVQQALPAYPQVGKPYTPTDGYFPLPPWAGLLVLAAWAAAILAFAVIRTRRADA